MVGERTVMPWRYNKYPDFDDRDAFASSRPPPSKTYTLDARGIPVAARFPTTAVVAPMVAGAGTGDPNFPQEYTNFLDVSAEVTYPRIINLWTDDTAAFDVRIEWNAGGGRGGTIFITATGGALQFFCVAKSLRIDCGNWTVNARTMNVSVENGQYGQTQELHLIIRRQALAAGANITFNLPAYARSVAVASDNPAQRANILVTQLDDTPINMSAYNAAFGNGNIPVGACTSIQITNNDAAALANYVADFTLGYR